MYAIRSYYAGFQPNMRSPYESGQRVEKSMNSAVANLVQIMQHVITSYSIHYTKLYEGGESRGEEKTSAPAGRRGDGIVSGLTDALCRVKKIHGYGLPVEPPGSTHAITPRASAPPSYNFG